MSAVPTPRAAIDAFTRPRAFPYTPEETALLDHAQRRDIAFKGHAVVTYSWGHQGPLALLVHGWESRASHWQAWVQPLREAGYQVMAVDNLAHGHSSGDRAHVALWGEALVSLGQQLGPVHTLIGHSVGSAAALYAFAHGLTVQASIHIAGPSSLSRTARRFARHLGLTDSDLQTFETLLEDALAQPLAQADLPALREGLRHPGLIVHDPQDQEVPFSESLDLAEAWPLAELVPADGVGHRRILRSPEVIARCLQAMR